MGQTSGYVVVYLYYNNNNNRTTMRLTYSSLSLVVKQLHFSFTCVTSICTRVNAVSCYVCCVWVSSPSSCALLCFWTNLFIWNSDSNSEKSIASIIVSSFISCNESSVSNNSCSQCAPLVNLPTVYTILIKIKLQNVFQLQTWNTVCSALRMGTQFNMGSGTLGM